MKRIERYIYIVLIIILVRVISAGTTYILMDKKSNNSEIKEKDKQEENKKEEEKITLSEKELEQYLSYVPNYIHEKDMIAYYFKKSDVNVMGEKSLIANALSFAVNDCVKNKKNPCQMTQDKIKYLYDEEEEAIYSFSLNYINQIIMKNYNYKITDLAETLSWDNLYKGAHGGFAYQNGYFLMAAYGLGDTNVYLSKILKYEANQDEIIIWEYKCFYDNGILKDYLKSNNKEFKTEEEAKNSFNKNSDDFTKYKHTYKKNDTGYYWYSTEVVEERI